MIICWGVLKCCANLLSDSFVQIFCFTRILGLDGTLFKKVNAVKFAERYFLEWLYFHLEIIIFNMVCPDQDICTADEQIFFFKFFFCMWCHNMFKITNMIIFAMLVKLYIVLFFSKVNIKFQFIKKKKRNLTRKLRYTHCSKSLLRKKKRYLTFSFFFRKT